MAEGYSIAVSKAILDCYLKATNITAPTTTYIQLHIGAPGSAGTSNVAHTTLRKRIDNIMDAATNTSNVSTSATNTAVTWTSVTVTGAGTTETYTKCSLWDHLTNAAASDFIMSGSVSASLITEGDNFTVAIAGITATIPSAS